MNETPGRVQLPDDAAPQTAPGVSEAGAPKLFFEKRDGRYYALLPSGKRPEIRPIFPPAKLRDIMAAHPRPQVPMVDVQPEGVALAQRFPNPKDPAYTTKLAKWRQEYMAAMIMRCLFEGLVVPEDNQWSWLLEMTGVAVPDSGPERVRLYAQEEHPEFWDATKPGEAAAFVAAVQQITLPSEAGIAIARSRFRHEVEGGASDEPAPASGGLQEQSGDGGAADGQGV